MNTQVTDFEGFAHLVASGAARPLLEIVAPVIADLGFELLRIRITGDEKGSVLQVMALNESGTITVEECETISRSLSAVLDVEDPIRAEYTLEISSPGMGRPLCRPADFTNWVGYEAKLELSRPIDGRKRFRGRLKGFENDEALLEVVLEGYDTPQILGFKLVDMAECRLVANDELVAAVLKSAKDK